MTMIVQYARLDDLDAIKRLCDDHRLELGFVMRPTLEAAIQAQEVMVARETVSGLCIGLVHYHHRRDAQTTLYHLVVVQNSRWHGVGRALVFALRDEARSRGKSLIRLKCPESLPANQFYAKVGFAKAATEPGKLRSLNLWEMGIE